MIPLAQSDSFSRIVSQKPMMSSSSISNPSANIANPERSRSAVPGGRSLSHGALQARTSNLPMIEAALMQRRESNAEHRGSTKSTDTASIGTGAAKHATTDTHVFDASGQPIHNRAYEAHGVRFVPAEVIFYNAFRGQCYTTLISISNISSHLLQLSISQPYSSAFHVKDDGTVIALAPGLSITRKIIFKCAEGKLFDSVVPIRIHDSMVLLPIKVIPGQVHVIVEPSILNFGRIDLGSAFVSRTVTLHNRGSISAKYAIDMSKNELDIMITRRTGSIKPFGTVEIKVQLSGLVVGEHETEFWVKSTPASRFIVRVTVVVPFLMAVHPFATEEFTLLDMAPCFPGTQRYETFLIRNSSSDTSAVVVLAESDGLVVPPEAAAHDDVSFQYFKLSPSDGTLAPFESRIFTLWFTPRVPSLEKGWKQPTIKERTAQYLCFFRVQRVTVTNIEDTEPIGAQDEARACQLDPIQQQDSYTSNNMTQRTMKGSMSLSEFDNEEKNNIIRVCAYSIAITPILHVVPDELIFGNVKIGQKINKVVRLYNPCELPLGFSFVKQAHLTVCPPTAQFLQPKKSIEVTVQLHPRSLQFEQKRLVFELLSFRNLTDEKHLEAIGQVSIRLVIKVESEVPPVTPQFLPGITPRTNLEGEEVGLHTELVLFSSNCPNIPKAVVWPKTIRGKPWLKSNARVAFPNELRRSLRVTANDGDARSIFTGQPRYNVPDDPSNVYSPQELEFKKKEVAKYKGFVKEQAEAKINYMMELDEENKKPKEYEVSDQKLYALLRSQPPLPPPELKPFMTHPAPHDVLCPLTPLQLFNIKVQPQVIDFGKMPPKTDCNTTIAVDNMNGFPISVRFKSYKESLKVHGGSFIVPSQSTSFQKITLHLETTGKHYTNMSYIINTYHSYDMKVCAEVEVRSLILEPGELTFRDQGEREIFETNLRPVKLINPLGSPTYFKWKIPAGSPFGVVPVSGSVPSRSSLRCTVFSNMKNGNVLGSVLILKVDEGTHSHFPVNFIPSDKFTLTLFSPKISCPNIPLGVEFIKKIIIYNHGRRLSFFSIDDRSLPKGVKVRPFVGMIKPRSCCTLSVHLHFTEVKKFSFKVPISSLTSKSLVFTCNGFVTYPLVTFKPQSIIFRKTPVHSNSYKEFTIQNECQGEVMLKFLMDEFSQFKISSSNDFTDEAATLRNTALILTPRESRSLYLHFEPHDIAGYSFLLPVLINDILGPPVLSNALSQRTSVYIPLPADDTNTANKIPGMTVPEKLGSITVEVAVQRGYIKCNSFLFEFFKTDLKEKGAHSLSITNIHPRMPVTIRIQHPEPEDQPFSISGRHGYVSYDEPMVLAPDETMEVAIMFVPPYAGTYAAGVPIYVDEFSRDHPYATIKLTGVFYRSSLTCTSSMVNFLPVDVDVEIDKVIQIIANHQPEDTKLKVMLVDSVGAPLDDIFTIVYPETDEIPYGIDNFVIQVKIKFRSEVPRSVIAFLTATDGYDGECKITVTAIADRSSLTTHAFNFINSLNKIPRAKPPKQPRASAANLSRASAGKRSLALSIISSSTPGRTAALPRLSVDTTESEDHCLTSAIIEEIEQYPLFPKSSSDTEYAKHMRWTKESMEDWLYEQGFQGQYRMVIGEDYYFSEPFQTAVNSTNKNARFEDVKSVIDLIIKLTGREFTAQYPLPPNCPIDKIGRIDFAVQAYKSVVLFLNRQGGHLIHVSPIYLLDYDDYVVYHEKLKPAHLDGLNSLQEVSQLDLILEQEVYVRLSIQCWLDVFLQLYKILVFYPTMIEPIKSSVIDAVYSSGRFTEEKGWGRNTSKQQGSAGVTDQEKGEESLLAWMDSIFAMDRPSCVPPRNITNFTEDLKDGVVLGVITAHYCPFLSSYLADLFWNPTTKAEHEQNLGVLSLAWAAVKIGLSFSAQDLTSPHPVKMLMICSLLYSVLPTYLPRDTLVFEACLADNVNKQLKITNPSSHSIGFAMKKFDPQNCFSLSNVKNNILKIAGNSSKVLEINFFAKHVNRVTATLVLCGTQVSGGFASNMVFIMKGMPAKLQHKLAFNITCPLYKVSKVKTSLNSPYATEGEFSLCITEAEPKSSTAKKLKPWSQVSQRKVIRSLYIPETTMTVPPLMEIPATLTLIVSAFQLKHKDFWIIFSNPKIGDFVVKVTIIPDLTAPQYILHPPYPSRACSGSNKEGACDNPTCPRVVLVQIPSKNFRLWSAAKSMLSNTLNEKEKAFWDDYLETGLGLKLLSWIARQYHIGNNDMSFLFQQSITYKVECDSPLVTCPPEITIEDVHSEDPVNLPVHLNIGAKAGLAVDIKLKAEHELRFYHVVFYRKRTDRSEKSQMSSVLTPSKSQSQSQTQTVDSFKKADSKPICCDKNYIGVQHERSPTKM